MSQPAICPARYCILSSSAVRNLGTVLSMNPLFITASGALAAAGAIAYGAVHPRSQLFGRTICRTNSPRKLAITFDDGPNPAITPKLLDLLERHNAKATFFLIGRYVRECPELVRETIAHTPSGTTPKRTRIFCGWRLHKSGSSCASATTRSAMRWARRPSGFARHSGCEIPGSFRRHASLATARSCGR